MSGSDLRAAAATMPRNWFATVEGVRFDDLPARLERAGLRSHPLYLEGADPAVVAGGPHLIALADQREIAALIELAEDKPALVFWSWPGTLETLRRHLRGLNMCQIPNENQAQPDDPEYETVLFRHWDPNVLAVTLPVLTHEQQSRYLGEAAGVVYDATEHGGVVRAATPAELPTPNEGMLKLAAPQLEALSRGRLEASHRRIAAYLQTVAPDYTARMDDQELLKTIPRFDGEARELGLTKEDDIARWAFLQIVSGGDLLANADIKDVFAAVDTPLGPTERLDMLVKAVCDGLEVSA